MAAGGGGSSSQTHVPIKGYGEWSMHACSGVYVCISNNIGQGRAESDTKVIVLT